MTHGEFAVRGSLIDLFPMGSEWPYRVDLFDREIDSIRVFDPETQRTNEKIERISMLPAREFPVDEAAVARFRKAYREQIEGDPQRSLIYRGVSEGQFPGGIEYYLPLFFEQHGHAFRLRLARPVWWCSTAGWATRPGTSSTPSANATNSADTTSSAHCCHLPHCTSTPSSCWGLSPTTVGSSSSRDRDRLPGPGRAVLRSGQQAGPAGRDPGKGGKPGTRPAGDACARPRAGPVRRRDRRAPRGPARDPARLRYPPGLLRNLA